MESKKKNCYAVYFSDFSQKTENKFLTFAEKSVKAANTWQVLGEKEKNEYRVLCQNNSVSVKTNMSNGPQETYFKLRKRYEREACINNLQLNLNGAPNRESKRYIRPVDNTTYTKRPTDKLIPGSLENVSNNPWGEVHGVEQSSLRRSRSLAISRESIFTSFDFPRVNGHSRQRRSQLIPRAKLIDRSVSRDQTRYKEASVENLEGLGRSDRESVHRQGQTKTRQSRKTYEEEEIYSYASLNNIDQRNIYHAEQDNFSSRFKGKTSINTQHRASYDDLQGLSLPNYYPDSKCDTDITDNISITDNVSFISLDTNNNIVKPASNLGQTKFLSTGNISEINWERTDPDSIPYDENIVLTAKKSYTENLYAKPKTIRGPTPYHENYNYNKHRNSIKKASFEKPTINKDTTKNDEDEIQVDYFTTESDSNFDEINLYNDTAKVLEIHEGDSSYSKATTFCSYSNIEDNPVYGKISVESKLSDKINNDILEVSKTQTQAIKDKSIVAETLDQIKTLIEVTAGEQTNQDTNQYKTIVTVESENTETSEEDNKSNKSKQHSHNYLREFLETQKGSKKPLQNFIVKKLSNLSRRNSKENHSLSENQFYSLPDISVSENLKKCEKIDRKLRKCEQVTSNRNNYNSKENRFIVNIGRHFDITANSNIPVDFEVKIAKVPKTSNKSKKKKSTKKDKTDEQLIEAVKNLKQTLNGSSLSLDENYCRKPEIVEVKSKINYNFDCPDKDRETQEVEMEKSECAKEYKEKVDTMRNYWGKMSETIEDQEETKCKIVDLQTKVEDVKKKFEPTLEKEEKKINKVKLVKQLFEVKTTPDKVEKLSPLIKESCSYFEKPSKHIQIESNQFESLNPNIVEIVGKKEKENDKTNKEIEPPKIPQQNKIVLQRQGKPVSKSNSITYPEFDHVRYKVVKSDLFQKKIFANCDKEDQFDGLMQYLKDYSFQELLIDNNIVIIEPIRSKVQYEPTRPSKKPSTNVTHLLQKNNENESNSLRKHFFYHPIRVNKEVNDDELPNPDTVRQVRQFFEGGLKRSQSNQEMDNTSKEKYGRELDPDKDHCSVTDSNSNPSNISDFGSQENIFDFMDSGNCCEQQYVSEDILEKIREYGSTVTYYGGRVVKQQSGQPILTKVIMEEIKNNERRFVDCNCKVNGNNKDCENDYQGVKFKLVKSNSCSSRLELVGTKNINESKKKFFSKHKKLIHERNQKNGKNLSIKEELNEGDILQNQTISEKNAINESIKNNKHASSIPKIIGEERKVPDNKMTQWGDVKRDTIYSTITYSDKSNQKTYYEFHNYDKVKTKTHKEEMEFEPYEVA